jgi:hypothetical protein
MVRFWLSVDAGALGIVARDHAHTFSPWPISRCDPVYSSLEFVGLVARYSSSLLADRYRARVAMHVRDELPIISVCASSTKPTSR